MRRVHDPGDTWIIRGAMEYIPSVQATIMKEVEALSLDKKKMKMSMYVI